ncbi:MAG: HPr(Ser) kinase/phosphatase [Pseudomonadota bacterium]|nr:HPr(Ser) kinase/phosphatase [Pseudomonadota bacterium]
MSAKPLRAQTVFQALQEALGLAWIGGPQGAERMLSDERGPGDALGGLLNLIHPHKIQILGDEEYRFLDSLEDTVRAALLRRLFSLPTGAVLACGDPARAEALRPNTVASGTPLWHSRAGPGEVLDRLNAYQRSLESVSTLLHGVFMEVHGLGVLLSGSSGCGKSELALELVSRGHRLIADDTPKLTRVAPNVIEGTCPETLRDFLEVRGLGILNIRRMFGDSAIKRNKRLRLVVNLVRQEETYLSAEVRLRGTRNYRYILDCAIPEITLPIAPSRNLAVLVECAVRDHILRLNGYNAEQDLSERLHHEMADKPACE